ncbi:MAG TPA: RIP metalloprotease RseP [Aestuariivirgaceae bacterium]|nr:RIP metalloprotease RseP [Aestuariivirgaceae bacterium]
MDFFAAGADWIVWFLSYVLPFLAVLTLIIFVHEFGHFQVARWCGVNVEIFSVGFGRAIAKWYDREGTQWKIAWIPLGGYVKFQGDANAASLPADIQAPAKPGDFHTSSVARRAAIVVAGPMANFVLAVIIFAASFAIVGTPVSPPVVEEVRPDSAAEAAGILPGDRILTIQGTEIVSFTEIQRIVSDRAGEELAITLERDGREIAMQVTPRMTEVPDSIGGTIRMGLLGISKDVSQDLIYERKDPIEAIGLGFAETYFVIERTLSYVKGMILGQVSPDQLAGPLGIAQISGQAASISFAALLNLAAVLSVSIGLINLFPIPMLDGGHLVFYAVEAVRGKPLAQNVQEMGFKVGLGLVLMLMLMATWNDITRLANF